MAFCSFSNEYDKEKILPLDSNFITDYLPEASGDAVRVYLYGLFVCRMQKDSTLQGIASELNLSEETVIDCFKFCFAAHPWKFDDVFAKSIAKVFYKFKHVLLR